MIFANAGQDFRIFFTGFQDLQDLQVRKQGCPQIYTDLHGKNRN
jgi:hypothetical protein